MSAAANSKGNFAIFSSKTAQWVVDDGIAQALQTLPRSLPLDATFSDHSVHRIQCVAMAHFFIKEVYFFCDFQMATKSMRQEQIHYRGVLTRWVCDGVAELDHSLLLFLFHHTTSPVLQVLTPNSF